MMLFGRHEVVEKCKAEASGSAYERDVNHCFAVKGNETAEGGLCSVNDEGNP